MYWPFTYYKPLILDREMKHGYVVILPRFSRENVYTFAQLLSISTLPPVWSASEKWGGLTTWPIILKTKRIKMLLNPLFSGCTDCKF